MQSGAIEMRYLPALFLTFCLPLGLLMRGVFPVWGNMLFIAGLFGLGFGLFDLLQRRHSILKNYPLVARLRFLLESIRPEIRQYFLESDHEEVPYSREQRALIYSRSKNLDGVRPFGTLKNVHGIGHEWINHSIVPTQLANGSFRVSIGGRNCQKPYDSSVLNISGMSYGALSPTAIEALNLGAQIGEFAHTTGEGSISRFHKKHGGGLIWQIGSGYFGCRGPEGGFDQQAFARLAADDQVKMIEVKLSQGAKPGHGGVLPGSKVTEAIAEARGVPLGEDCISPASHSAFSTPLELVRFVDLLRRLSGGKPVGIKLCIGHPWEFFAIAKAMQTLGKYPDFITVDGAEGGTGAAPIEFADHVGAPLREGLMLVHNTLVGLNIRDQVKIVASGKLVSAFDMARAFALGADVCNMARGFMFSIGCIQAQACHTGKCPTGVTSQDPGRYRAIHVAEKHKRVANFHENTVHALIETIEACGLEHPKQLSPHHLMIRVNSREVRSAASQYDWLKRGALLREEEISHPTFQKFWEGSKAFTFSIQQHQNNQTAVSVPVPQQLQKSAMAVNA